MSKFTCTDSCLCRYHAAATSPASRTSRRDTSCLGSSAVSTTCPVVAVAAFAVAVVVVVVAAAAVVVVAAAVVVVAVGVAVVVADVVPTERDCLQGKIG